MKKLFIMTAALIITITASAENPRVYVEDSQSWEVKADLGGNDDAFGGTMSGGARPQTAEIIKTFGEKCRNVVINNRKEKSDYVVLIHHEGGKDLVRRDNKVVVFNRDGDAILSHSTRSLGNAVNDACTAIMKHWMAQSAAVDASVTAPKNTGETSLQVTSTPAGADILVNEEFVGNTPSTIRLKPGEYRVVVRKNGYVNWERELKITGGDVNLAAELAKKGDS
jgi:hypothetical protein